MKKIISGFKKNLTAIVLTVISILLLEILVAFFILPLWDINLNFSIPPGFKYDWVAFGALGQWLGAFIGLLVPFIAIYITYALEENKKEIGSSNTHLLDELKDFESEYEGKLKILSDLINKKGNIDFETFDEPPSLSLEELKEKTLKFINIAMITNTRKVAEHLNKTDRETFDLLEDMLKHDRSISAGGKIRFENIDQIVWTKRK